MEKVTKETEELQEVEEKVEDPAAKAQGINKRKQELFQEATQIAIRTMPDLTRALSKEIELNLTVVNSKIQRMEEDDKLEITQKNMEKLKDLFYVQAVNTIAAQGISNSTKIRQNAIFQELLEEEDLA